MTPNTATGARTETLLEAFDDNVYSRRERLLDIVERSIGLLERLGGPSEAERESLRELLVPPAPAVIDLMYAPTLRSKPVPPAPMNYEPVAKSFTLSNIELNLLDSMAATDMSTAPVPATSEPQVATPRADVPELPRHPRVAGVWRYLFGADPDHRCRIRCGHYLAKAYRQDFGRMPRVKVTDQGGTYSKQKLYPQDWMIAKVREFAAQFAGITVNA